MCNVRRARGLLGHEQAVQLLSAGWLGFGSWQLVALVATSLLSLVDDAVREEDKAVSPTLWSAVLAPERNYKRNE